MSKSNPKKIGYKSKDIKVAHGDFALDYFWKRAQIMEESKLVTRYLVATNRPRERRELLEREMYVWERGVSLFVNVKMKEEKERK